jgi:hypothetical protein
VQQQLEEFIVLHRVAADGIEPVAGAIAMSQIMWLGGLG